MLCCQLWANQAKAIPFCSDYMAKPTLLLLYSLSSPILSFYPNFKVTNTQKIMLRKDEEDEETNYDMFQLHSCPPKLAHSKQRPN